VPDASGTAAALPAPAQRASVAALLFDLERIVDAEENSGWLLDEAAQRQIQPDVMQSVCRALPAVRASALERLEGESRKLGDARRLYIRAHEQLTPDARAALSASRRASALQQAIAIAPEQCPFWLRPDASFRGLQSTRDRVVFNFDTGGTAQLRKTEGSWTLGAGGFGRVLAGYSFTHFTLLSGIEFGGGALLQPKTNPTQFVINYLSALPVVLRLQRKAWHLDLEGAPVGLFQAGNTALSYGVRSGLLVGFSSLRLRGVLPWVGLGVASEYHFGNTSRPAATYFRGGVRVGGVWDP
jgi:hypothetical protein